MVELTVRPGEPQNGAIFFSVLAVLPVSADDVPGQHWTLQSESPDHLAQDSGD